MADKPLTEFVRVTLPELKWRESPNQSERQPNKRFVEVRGPVRLIVIHTAEGGYEGTVSWLCNPGSDASAHIVLNEDGSEATQLVRYSRKAWTQQAFNPVSISIEVAGRLRDRWLHPVRARRQLRSLARIVAFLLQEHGLPARWVQNKDRWEARGHTRHGDLTPEGGHPLCLLYTGVRWFRFRRLVRKEAERGGFRREWGKQ